MRQPENHLRELPPQDFSPTSLLDKFLGDDNTGFLSGVQALQEELKNAVTDSYHTGFAIRDAQGLLSRYADQARLWLGKSDSALTSEKPSRFARFNPNALWEYNPFLCVVGLMEALDISFRLSMVVWEFMVVPETYMFITLQRFVLQQRMRSVPRDDLLVQLTAASSPATRKNPDQPARNSPQADKRRTDKGVKKAIKALNGTGCDIRSALRVHEHDYFGRMSKLMLYRDCNWDTTKVIQNDDAQNTIMEMLTPHWEKDKLAVRSNEDESLTFIKQNLDDLDETSGRPVASKVSDIDLVPASQVRVGGSEYGPCGIGQLVAGEVDMVTDICGLRPLSGLDFMRVSLAFTRLFEAIEQRLEKLQNPLYLRYRDMRTKLARFRLVSGMMEKHPGSEEALVVVEEELDKAKMSVFQFTYWKQLDNRFPSLSAKRNLQGNEDCHE